MGMFAEAGIHCGAGSSAGIVDLPVAREASTDFPFIPGSGIKGALRDRARDLGRPTPEIDELFGKAEGAGELLISDARLLLLPVRSLTGSYRWLTSPLVLERYDRDRKRCGLPSMPYVTVDSAADAPSVLSATENSVLYLEEREFTVGGPCPVEAVEGVAPLIRHDASRVRLKNQMTVAHDDDFAWFCRYSLPVQARNSLKEITKQSRNLWYEESLPADTLLYSLVASRSAGAMDAFVGLFPESDAYLQVGGNETIGQGWTTITMLDAQRTVPT